MLARSPRGAVASDTTGRGDRRMAHTAAFAAGLTVKDTLAARTATTICRPGVAVPMPTRGKTTLATLTESTTVCCASAMLGAQKASAKAVVVRTFLLDDIGGP